MKRTGCASLALVFTLATGVIIELPSRAAAAAATASADAPLDEYFGRVKMSALRIRQRIDQLAARYRKRTASDADIIHDAGDVRVSLDDWLKTYPRDTWGPPTAFHLAQLYAQIQSPQARALAKRAFSDVATRFPQTTYGRQARLRLAQGFPALKAESAVVASPSPIPINTVAPQPSAPAPIAT